VPGIFDGLDVVPHAACACAIVKGIKSPAGLNFNVILLSD